MEFKDLTVARARQGLLKKEFSALELANKFLDKIETEDEQFFSFLTTTKDLALSQAKLADEKIAKGGDIPLLAGIPVAVKDNILVESVRCTAGSKILEDYIAPYDATVTRKLKEQGAVILGKTNLDEFAMGASTENSAFFTTKNPYDLKRVPGGSSGGSAAAVAADFCCAALGSDTGGSIRQPASFCGAVGLKPTYGSVSRYGVMAMASSLDQIGPLTKNVADSKAVFDAIKGKDARDATSANMTTDYRLPTTDKLKIGLPKEYFAKGLDPEVEKLVKGAINKLTEQGAEVSEISLPHSEYALACYYIIMASEVSSNLARFDGIKYGVSVISDKQSAHSDLLDVYLKSRGQYLGAEVRRRIMLGTYSLSSGYYDAYYARAQKVHH